MGGLLGRKLEIITCRKRQIFTSLLRKLRKSSSLLTDKRKNEKKYDLYENIAIAMITIIIIKV